MRSYVVINKRRGETPLAAIEHWKQDHSDFASLRASYAGRLDPMAEGKLLVLLGDECRKQKKYTRLDKEYEIEVVLDLSTDTGDTLGLPKYSAKETRPCQQEIMRALAAVIGSYHVPYPAFSSKTVGGKPLFMYALEGTLDSIRVPEHMETIYRTKLLSLGTSSSLELKSRIEEGLMNVPRSEEPSKTLGANFRQDTIRTSWHILFTSIPNRRFTTLRLRVTCGSGTYMRSLASRIGKELGTDALALSIRRTKIGVYKKFGPLRLWIRQY
jgi:tRNA pseudouridine55 synthase